MLPTVAFRVGAGSTVVSAIVWFGGLPVLWLVSGFLGIASEWQGIMGVMLGLALVPGAAVGISPAPALLNAVSRLTGLVVCASLVSTGIPLIIAVDGRLGKPAPGWVDHAASWAGIALLVWIVFASLAGRRLWAVGRVLFWLGTAVGVAILLLVPAYTITSDSSMLLYFLTLLLLWLCPAGLLAVFAHRLWTARLDAAR
jgi:hypothetical protein